MTALAAVPPPDNPSIPELAGQLTIPELLTLIAHTFHLGPHSGEQTLELRFENGRFRWAKLHTGRLGLDDIR